MSISLPVLALFGRVITLGVERIIVKKMGTNADSFCSTFLFFFLGALFLLPFVPMEGPTTWVFVPKAMASGLFYSVAFVCYVRSLSLEEASLVSPLYNFNIFFLAIMAFVWVGEPLSVYKCLGLVLLVYGASHLNRPDHMRSTFFCSMRALFHNRGCQFMIAASLLIAVGRVIDKSNIQNAPPVTYCFFLYLIIAAYVCIYVLLQGHLRGIFRLFRERPWTSMASGAINAYSYLFLLLAITEIDVSVAEPISMLGMVVTLFLSKWFLGENIRRRWFGVLLMVCGASVMFI
jgi:transporter family protein